MKRQIKLTLLGTMLLFTGASIRAMQEGQAGTVKAPAKQTVQQTQPVSPVDPKAAQSAQSQASPEVLEVKKDEKSNWFSNGCTTLKSIVTNKWVLGTGAVVVGAYIAFRIYQAYNEEEAEAEQPLV